jgi:hypothetical protein
MDTACRLSEETRTQLDMASARVLAIATVHRQLPQRLHGRNRDGRVSVPAVRKPQTASGWRLEVSDDGRGLPEGFEVDRSKGFGMKMVKTFVRKLDAKLAVSSRPGRTAFEIFSA